MLVHEATFAEDERERAAETGHSTASGAATVARDAEVRLLALNHVSMRYPVGLLRDEARAIFPQTVVPRDFDTIEIPLPERGEPALVRWSDSAEARAADAEPAEAEADGRDRDRAPSASSADGSSTSGSDPSTPQSSRRCCSTRGSTRRCTRGGAADGVRCA